MAGLIYLQRGFFDHTGVVLNGPLGDHHIADSQHRIQTARNTGERNRAASEAVGEQGGHQRGADLSHPGPGQDYMVAVEFADAELDVGNRMRRDPGHGGQQVRVFLRKRAEESDGHVRPEGRAPGTHARRGPFSEDLTR